MSGVMLRTAVRTSAGRRPNNEDAAYASPRLVAIADGVGGAAAGEVASGLAMLKMMSLDKRRLLAPLQVELEDAVADANAAIAFVTFYDPAHTGMATTLTALALSDDGAYLVANVGDSRAYLLRAGVLRRLTRDDSLVQEWIDRGALSEEQARHHPQRNVVLQALDGVERPLPRPRAIPGRADDRLLLCSDGVTDYLTDAEIADILSIHDADAAVDQLVAAALDRGSRDNVTAVIADVVAHAGSADGWLKAVGADRRR
jgi:protein phosphatase